MTSILSYIAESLNLSDAKVSPIESSLTACCVGFGWSDVIISYLILGLHPGSFFGAIFANDSDGILIHAHPLIKGEHITPITNWLRTRAPIECWGSYEKINNWCTLSQQERIYGLERAKLFLTDHELVLYILAKEEEK